jgi:putative oxidoreductase
MYVDPGLAILRVVVGGVVMAHGLQKLGFLGGAGPTSTIGMMGRISVKPEPLWAAVLVAAEVGGGALTALGFLGPVGPSLIVADMIVAAATVHWPNGFWNHRGGIEYSLTLGTAALSIALIGNGAWSIDRLIGLTMPDWLIQGWIAIVILGVVLAFVSRTTAEADQGQAA